MYTKNSVVPELDFAAYVGRRQARFTFELIDGLTKQSKGFLQPDTSTPPVLTHDTSRTIMRTIDGLALDRADSALVDPIRDRVLVVMEVDDVSYPLGKYLFTDATEFTSTAGTWINAQLMDEMFIVDQEIEAGVSYSLSNTLTASIVLPQVMRPVKNVVTYSFDPSNYVIIGGWSAGTNRGQILSAIALQGDYFNAWFDNTGVMRMIRSFDPAYAVPSFDWDATDHVLATPIARHSNLLTAPNKFVVVSNGGGDTSQPAVGSYSIPPTAPHSVQNRGFVITHTESIQIFNSTQAVSAAKNIALRAEVYEFIDVTTPADPRHDSYDVIQWDGELWLELVWSLPLVEGSVMTHTLRKAYK